MTAQMFRFEMCNKGMCQAAVPGQQLPRMKGGANRRGGGDPPCAALLHCERSAQFTSARGREFKLV